MHKINVSAIVALAAIAITDVKVSAAYTDIADGSTDVTGNSEVLGYAPPERD